MKKRLFSSIILTALCLAILFAGVSSSTNLCTKERSFICSSFAFVFNINSSPVSIAPDKGYAKFYASSDVMHRQELVSSIFHPPKVVS